MIILTNSETLRKQRHVGPMPVHVLGSPKESASCHRTRSRGW